MSKLNRKNPQLREVDSGNQGCPVSQFLCVLGDQEHPDHLAQRKDRSDTKKKARPYSNVYVELPPALIEDPATQRANLPVLLSEYSR